MKHTITFSFFLRAMGLAALLPLLTFCAGLEKGAGKAGQQFTAEDGVYEGCAQGYRGPIRVKVRMEDGIIAEIGVIESGEDRFVGGAAMEELIDLVLLYNTTDVDAVSGATESSKGFLRAVEDAIMNVGRL